MADMLIIYNFFLTTSLSAHSELLTAFSKTNVSSYLPHLLVRFAATLKSNHNYNFLIMTDNERFNLRSAETSPEARLDFKAGDFWSRGVTAFFDVRVTHVNYKCNQGKTTSTNFKEQEEEKKRKYQRRVLDVEMGSFTPLVFGTNGGMGVDCNCFLKRLAEKLSEKNEEPYHTTITWIRTSLFFEILRSVHTCVRGSRIPFHKIPQGDFIDDCRLNAISILGSF